jgi:hypothetical protein
MGGVWLNVTEVCQFTRSRLGAAEGVAWPSCRSCFKQVHFLPHPYIAQARTEAGQHSPTCHDVHNKKFPYIPRYIPWAIFLAVNQTY